MAHPESPVTDTTKKFVRRAHAVTHSYGKCKPIAGFSFFRLQTQNTYGVYSNLAHAHLQNPPPSLLPRASSRSRASTFLRMISKFKVWYILIMALLFIPLPFNL